MFEFYITQSKDPQIFLGAFRQRLDSLNCKDLLGKLSNDRSLVSAAGSDLKHSVHAARFHYRLAHAGNHVRLRDCLIVPDRQCHIFISPMRERFIQKNMAGRRTHNVEHLHTLNALIHQPTEQSFPSPLRRHADPT